MSHHINPEVSNRDLGREDALNVHHAEPSVRKGDHADNVKQPSSVRSASTPHNEDDLQREIERLRESIAQTVNERAPHVHYNTQTDNCRYEREGQMPQDRNTYEANCDLCEQGAQMPEGRNTYEANCDMCEQEAQMPQDRNTYEANCDLCEQGAQMPEDRNTYQTNCDLRETEIPTSDGSYSYQGLCVWRHTDGSLCSCGSGIEGDCVGCLSGVPVFTPDGFINDMVFVKAAKAHIANAEMRKSQLRKAMYHLRVQNNELARSASEREEDTMRLRQALNDIVRSEKHIRVLSKKHKRALVSLAKLRNAYHQSIKAERQVLSLRKENASLRKRIDSLQQSNTRDNKTLQWHKDIRQQNETVLQQNASLNKQVKEYQRLFETQKKQLSHLAAIQKEKEDLQKSYAALRRQSDERNRALEERQAAIAARQSEREAALAAAMEAQDVAQKVLERAAYTRVPAASAPGAIVSTQGSMPEAVARQRTR